MSTNKLKLDPAQNRLTVSQKGRNCGEIRFTFCVGDYVCITPSMVERAERELKRDPQHQQGYYDVLLVTPKGEELDFETRIL